MESLEIESTSSDAVTRRNDQAGPEKGCTVWLPTCFGLQLNIGPHWYMSSLLGLLIFCFNASLVLKLRATEKDMSGYIYIDYFLVILSAGSLFHCACLSNSGYVGLTLPGLFDEESAIYYYCESCSLRRPMNVLHCEYCNACVLDLDHHCPWVSKCVSNSNKRSFQFFLLCNMINVVYALIVTGLLTST